MRAVIFLLLNLSMISVGVIPAAHAQDANIAYVVSYFEVNAAATGKALGLLRQFGTASRKETGNLRFEILQRIGQPDQFAMLEAWKDKDAQAAHAAAAHTRQFREKLLSLLRGPYDERPHTALAVGPVQALPASEAAKAAVYAVTHVDIVGAQREVGVALVKRLSEDGRNDKGNVRFEALTQNSRTNHMTVVEIWTDRKAADAHGAAAYKREFREKLMPISGSLYDERFYTAVQ
jgi:quinol monooxygenase YgiN